MKSLSMKFGFLTRVCVLACGTSAGAADFAAVQAEIRRMPGSAHFDIVFMEHLLWAFSNEPIFTCNTRKVNSFCLCENFTDIKVTAILAYCSDF